MKSPVPPIPRKTSSFSTMRKVGLVFGVVCLLLLGLFVGWRVSLHRDNNRQFDRIRAAGYPTSGAELASWLPAIPEAENGALVMTQAFALLHTLPGKDARAVTRNEILLRNNKWSPEMYELVQSYVQTNAAAVTWANEALRFSRFRYPVDYANELLCKLPHLAKLKDLALVVALRASLDAAQGRGEDWPAQVEFILKLAATLEGDPTTISYLTHHAMIRMAAKVTERNLEQSRPNKEACLKLQHAFTRAGATNSLPLALATDRALHIPVFQMYLKKDQKLNQTGQKEDQQPEAQVDSRKPAFLFWLTGFMERDLHFYLQTMDKAISAAALPTKESLAATNMLENAVTTAEKRYYLLSIMTLPPFAQIFVREAATHAQIALVKTALAVECFRNQEGRLPEGVKELIPQYLEAIPMDPFDGGPIRYRRLARGYVIYSIDSDGHDDGGREKPEPKKVTDNNTYDLTFIVER